MNACLQSKEQLGLQKPLCFKKICSSKSTNFKLYPKTKKVRLYDLILKDNFACISAFMNKKQLKHWKFEILSTEKCSQEIDDDFSKM